MKANFLTELLIDGWLETAGEGVKMRSMWSFWLTTFSHGTKRRAFHNKTISIAPSHAAVGIKETNSILPILRSSAAASGETSLRQFASKQQQEAVLSSCKQTPARNSPNVHGARNVKLLSNQGSDVKMCLYLWGWFDFRKYHLLMLITQQMSNLSNVINSDMCNNLEQCILSVLFLVCSLTFEL